MSSVLDFALGMGASDSGGSIHQTLVEWEVIPIGNSSSEEVRHETSNSGSSSFERLMDLCHADEGSSRPCERVRPSTAPLDKKPILVTIILPSSLLVATGKSDDGDVRVSPHNKRSHNAGTPSSHSFIAGYEWVKDDVLKYCSSITSSIGVRALWCQLGIAKVGDSHKMTIQACGKDEFSFLHAAFDCPPFFYVYRCLFKVLNLTFSLNTFQCALLRCLIRFIPTTGQWWGPLRSCVHSSKSDPACLCSFTSFRWSWQGRLVGWMSLNSVYKKMFEFDSSVFCRFKDHFFKVKATNVVDDGLLLMHDGNGEPRFLFY